MGKDKIRKFKENETFRCLVQPPMDEVLHKDHPLKGHWGTEVFGNDHPIILELGCGKGEYTIALAERFPENNYIGVDIKGARLFFVAGLHPSKEGLYVCNWQGHDKNAVEAHSPQVFEMNDKGEIVWSLNDNQTFGMISTIDVIE